MQLVRVVALSFAAASVMPCDMAAQLATAPAIPAPRDSAAAAILRFFFAWNAAWRVSEAERHELVMSWPIARPKDDFREMHAMCYPDESEWAFRYIGSYGGRAIRSAGTRDAVCPSWFAGEGSPLHDESDGIDAWIAPNKLSQVRAHRAALIGTLRVATGDVARDDWLAGQLVRFLVDQNMLDSAAAVAARCAASQWWCSALRGYVAAKQGAVVESARFFDRAVEVAPDSVRCVWTDHALIVDSTARAHYEKLSCTQRQPFNRNLWWLSDPLFVVPGNERRVEQFVRHVVIALRAGLATDERFGWLPQAGGDARRELVTRYGWPSYMFWPGYGYDIGTAGSAAPTHRIRRPANDTYTTYEYSRDRASLIPSVRAAIDPYAAHPNDWAINAETARDSRHSSFSALGDKRTHGMRQYSADSALITSMPWWPGEHMRLGYQLSELPQGQTAMLRRQDSVLIAVATVVPRDSSPSSERSTLQASLVSSTSEDSVTVVAQRATRPDSRLVMRGQIRPSPSVIGVEVVDRAVGTSRASRIRFGLTPPPSLASFVTGDLGVSAPVLLAPISPDQPSGARATDTGTVLDRMLATHRIERPALIGVYWETYGFAPTDSVDIAIWIERYTPQGLLRRLGAGIGIVPDLNTPIALQWREPQAGRERQVLSGRVPVIARTMELDLATLIPGDYWLEVAVGRVGETPVRARRGFVIPQ